MFQTRLLNKALQNTRFRICLMLLIVASAAEVQAQITSPTANKISSTAYPVSAENDSVYIFYSPPGTSVTGSLSASLPVAGIYTFEWFMYNEISGDFDISLLNYNGVSPSQVNNLSKGGYRVHIFNGTDTDTTFTAWVYIDRLKVAVTKDADENLLPSAFFCGIINLVGVITVDTFYYFDPLSKNQVMLVNNYMFEWTEDNPELTIYHTTDYLDPQTIDNPPYLDTWFILTATDNFGMKDVDSVFYKSIEVKPLFSFQLFDPKEDKREFVDATAPAEGDAPLRIKFKNESVNGSGFEWIYSADSAKSGFFASELTDNLDLQPEYLYRIPGDYFIGLVATSEAGCIDTFKLADPITVLPSLLEVPNVFSPDGDATNPVFKVKFQSIKEFSIRIFDRAGKMVYRAEVSDMYTWEGWNGNVMDSDRKASAGVYFYVIEATGWDKEYYHKGQYRGVVYLFRGEGQ